MESLYVEIAYVELKRDIHVPIEWPISKIKQLILCFAEKIIEDGPSYILQINQVPAKLIYSESNCVYTFQKISQEEVKGILLYDVEFPIDGDRARIEIFSGENQDRSWSNCAIASIDKEMVSRRKLSRSHIIGLLIFIIISVFIYFILINLNFTNDKFVSPD